MILSDASEVNIWEETLCLKLMCLGQADHVITVKHQVTMLCWNIHGVQDRQMMSDIQLTWVLHQDLDIIH